MQAKKTNTWRLNLVIIILCIILIGSVCAIVANAAVTMWISDSPPSGGSHWSSITIYYGEQITLYGNPSAKSVLTWTSNNTDIVEILSYTDSGGSTNKYATVKGKSAGSTSLYVHAKRISDNSTTSVSPSITVKADLTLLKKDSSETKVAYKKITLNPGDTYVLNSTSASFNKDRDWSGWDSNIISVTTSDGSSGNTEKYGTITAKAPGTTVISIKLNTGTSYGSTGTKRYAMAYCEVKVNKIPVTSVTVSPTSKTIKVDETLQLSATVAPNNASYKTVTWTTSSSSIATVSSSGLVTGKGASHYVDIIKIYMLKLHELLDSRGFREAFRDYFYNNTVVIYKIKVRKQ